MRIFPFYFFIEFFNGKRHETPPPPSQSLFIFDEINALYSITPESQKQTTQRNNNNNNNNDKRIRIVTHQGVDFWVGNVVRLLLTNLFR